MSTFYVILLMIVILLLLVAVLLFVPIHLIAEYNEELEIKLKVMFFKFNLYGNTKKMNSSSPSGNLASNETLKFDETIRETKEFGVLKFLDSLGKTLKVSGKALSEIFKKTDINSLVFIMKIGGKDAYSTAISYGQTSAVINLVYGYIMSVKPPKIYEISVKPDFLSEKNYLRLQLDVSSRIFYIVVNFLKYAKELSGILNFKHAGEKDEQ